MPSTIERLDSGKFERLARVFSKNWGVRVLLEGLTPCATNDGRIFLPVNSDNLSYADQQVIEGVLDHEVSHVREEVEAKARKSRGLQRITPLEQAGECKDNIEKLFWNCYEDNRIERNARSRWPGVADNLRRMSRHYVDLQKKAFEAQEPVNSWQLVATILAHGSDGDKLEWLPDDLDGLLELLRPDLELADQTKDAEQCYRLALWTIEKVRDLMPDEPPPPLPSPGDEPEKSESGGEGSEEGEKPSGSSEQPEKSDDDGGGGSGSDGDDDDGESPSGDDEGEDGPEQEPGDSGSTAPGRREDDEPEDESWMRSFREGLKQEPGIEDPMDPIKGKVEDAAEEDATYNRRWAPHPQAVKRDRWRVPDAGSANTYHNLSSIVRPQVAVMRSKLRVRLQTLAEDRIEADRESGAVDVASLYSLRLGNKRIFNEQVPGVRLDTAVSILVDQSASMGERGKYLRAREAAVAISETLHSIVTPFEVIGWTNTHGNRVPDESPYTRHLPFSYYVYKAFAENYLPVRTRLCGLGYHQENVDGEAVLAVARRLAVRPEDRKILIVLSDGKPLGGEEFYHLVQWHLGQVIRRVARAGIEIYGVGICSHSVKHYYTPANGSDYVIVNRVDELAVQLVRLLSGRLMAKRAAA